MEQSDWRKTIESIARNKISVVTVFSDFCRVAACAVALQTREEEYLETIAHYSKEEIHEFSKAFAFLVNEMQSKPFTDVLGPFYTSVASKMTVSGRGEFYTPPEVCELMARIIGDVDRVIEEGKPITVNEPSCGSAGTILALAKQYAPKEEGEPSYVDLLRVTCQDLSPTACDMAYVNLTLWGVPAKIYRGNTLENKYDMVWKNMHWIRVGEDRRLRDLAMFDELKSITTKLTPTREAFPEVETGFDQAVFDF